MVDLKESQDYWATPHANDQRYWTGTRQPKYAAEGVYITGRARIVLDIETKINK